MFRLRMFSRVAKYSPIVSIGTKALAMSSFPEIHQHKSSTQGDVETAENYESAIKILNSLQSNAQAIAVARKNQALRKVISIPQTLGALETAGLSLDLLDNLDIVHVAGTKGKGMTCAFTESILRSAGLKTGFFSSPHLTSVRERIRINGKPLSGESFAKHFFTVYHRLKKLQEPGAPFEMPHYFRFLTCMAFHVFIEEEVDAVVLEVGIGGKHDCTNVIRKPVVTGISSLGLEHQSILGNTLEEIALQKAGIMKKDVPTYTVESHPPHILELLRSHAKSVECSLHCVPPLDLSKSQIKLGVDDGAVARLNAGLAVGLANEFLFQRHPHLLSVPKSEIELKYCGSENLLPFHLKGLQSTQWDGRFQVFKVSDQLTFFLDGAHTLDSLAATRKWFEKKTSGSSFRILVFNLTGERLLAPLLKPFAESDIFELAVFCPFVGSENKTSLDNWSAMENGKDPIEVCRKHVDVWKRLQSTSEGMVCSSAEATIKSIAKMLEENSVNGNVQTSASVLVTGSLHLVGTFLSVLDPTRND